MFPRHLRPPKPASMDYIPLHKGNARSRSVYTIHEREKHELFAFHLDQEDETSRTCVAVFLQEGDALTYAMLLEEYKRNMGAWPPLAKSDPKLDLVKKKRTLDEAAAPLDKLYLAEWSEEEVQDLCVHIMANTLIFYSVEERENLVDIRAGLAEADIATPQLKRRFEEIYDLKL